MEKIPEVFYVVRFGDYFAFTTQGELTITKDIYNPKARLDLHGARRVARSTLKGVDGVQIMEVKAKFTFNECIDDVIERWKREGKWKCST